VPHGGAPSLAPHGQPLGRAAGAGAIAEAIERWMQAGVSELRT
jgi:hypothetical protein